MLERIVDGLNPVPLKEHLSILFKSLSSDSGGYQANLDGMILFSNTMILLKFLAQCPSRYHDGIINSLTRNVNNSSLSVQQMVNYFYESSVACLINARLAIGKYDTPLNTKGAPDGVRDYQWGMGGSSMVHAECKRLSKAYQTPSRYSEQILTAVKSAYCQFHKRGLPDTCLVVFLDMSLDYAESSDSFKQDCLRILYNKLKIQLPNLKEEQIVFTCFHPADPMLNWQSFEPRFLPNGILNRSELCIGVDLLHLLELYTASGNPIGLDNMLKHFWNLGSSEPESEES